MEPVKLTSAVGPRSTLESCARDFTAVQGECPPIAQQRAAGVRYDVA